MDDDEEPEDFFDSPPEPLPLPLPPPSDGDDDDEDEESDDDDEDGPSLLPERSSSRLRRFVP